MPSAAHGSVAVTTLSSTLPGDDILIVAADAPFSSATTLSPASIVTKSATARRALVAAHTRRRRIVSGGIFAALNLTSPARPGRYGDVRHDRGDISVMPTVMPSRRLPWRGWRCGAKYRPSWPTTSCATRTFFIAVILSLLAICRGAALDMIKHIY